MQTSLVVVAAVVILFWLRVWVAVSDRLKRYANLIGVCMQACNRSPHAVRPSQPSSENVESLRKDVLLKRLSGKLGEDDAEALRRAEEEQATPVLGPVGSFLRGLRLVTEGRTSNSNQGAASQEEEEDGRRGP